MPVSAERRLKRLIETLDARLLQAMTDREDISDDALREIATLETARSAAVRLLAQVNFEEPRARRAAY